MIESLFFIGLLAIGSEVTLLTDEPPYLMVDS